MEEQHRASTKRAEQLEAEREAVNQRFKREREQMEGELEERRAQAKKAEGEMRDMIGQKMVMKKQIDEYEGKVKSLILEFEEQSKKHIRELNEVHEQYRGYKSSSIELEGRIQ
jgi:SMC interacting uncharacterized protein involved in chromosome segregation